MNKKICENCGNEHDGSYGSGRFCSKKCRGAFTAKMPKKHKRNEKYICCFCNAVISGRNALLRHKKENHPELYGDHAWNRGRTKENDIRIAKQVESFKQHVKEGKIHVWCEGQILSDSIKKKISNSMKKAHAEGRAHNIGESRWNNEPSYPEKWFMEVIANEFNDKNYVREYPFHRYSLDFAWLDKKKCIEIDGDQHQRFEDYKERDKKKDKLLEKEHWKVLRLVWKDVFVSPKKFITLAKDFIDG